MDKIINQYIAKIGLNTFPLTEDKVIELCELEGFKVRSYSAGAKLINAVEATNEMLQPAFLFSRDKYKYIFYNDTLSASDRLFYITHELCHIVLKHSAKGELRIESENHDQEDESNSSAYELLAPSCVLRDMGVTSTEDISNITGLSYGRAEIVFSRLHVYKGKNGVVENQIVRNFRKGMGYKDPEEIKVIDFDLYKKKKDERNTFWLVANIISFTVLAVVIGYFIYAFNQPKFNYYYYDGSGNITPIPQAYIEETSSSNVFYSQ